MSHSSTHPNRPLLLMILDGWGIRKESEFNAIANARTPTLDYLSQEYPSIKIGTSGLDVGLPPGQMGNSEVGHQNLGAGRIVYQDFTRITKSIENRDFFANPVLNAAMNSVLQKGTALHLMGLLSDGGVHSHIKHLMALLELAKSKNLSTVWIHAILDGRDTPPTSGIHYARQLEKFQNQIGIGSIATVMGRYYAMDRDNRWDRVEKAYLTMTQGGPCWSSTEEAIQRAYQQGETDEFVQPLSIVQEKGESVKVLPGDGVIFYNFRADRAREITRAFTEENFSSFPRRKLDLSAYVCMTEYDETFALPKAFPPATLTHIFPEVISQAGLKQLRIAETEKYAHVTFFFNGGEEKEFPGEKRILIPSPRDVATYDQIPEMSAYLVTDEVLRQIDQDRFDVIILNFANGDMVGGIPESMKRLFRRLKPSINVSEESIKH